MPTNPEEQKRKIQQSNDAAIRNYLRTGKGDVSFQYRMPAMAAPEDVGESPGFVESVARGAAQGGVGLASGASSALRWAGDVAGSPTLANLGDRGSDYLDELSQKIAPKGEDFAGSFLENPSVKRAATLMAQAIPSLAASIGIGLATAPVAGPAGGAIVGGALLGGLEGAPVYEGAREAGKSISEASAIGGAATAGSILLEALPVGKFIGGMGGNVIKRAAKGMALESGTEAAQQFWQNMVTKYGYDATQSLAEGLVESAIAGGGTGAIAGAAFEKADVNRAAEEIGKDLINTSEKVKAKVDVKDSDLRDYLNGRTEKDPRQAALEKAWEEYEREEAPKYDRAADSRKSNQRAIDEIARNEGVAERAAELGQDWQAYQQGEPLPQQTPVAQNVAPQEQPVSTDLVPAQSREMVPAQPEELKLIGKGPQTVILQPEITGEARQLESPQRKQIQPTEPVPVQQIMEEAADAGNKLAAAARLGIEIAPEQRQKLEAALTKYTDYKNRPADQVPVIQEPQVQQGPIEVEGQAADLEGTPPAEMYEADINSSAGEFINMVKTHQAENKPLMIDFNKPNAPSNKLLDLGKSIYKSGANTIKTFIEKLKSVLGPAFNNIKRKAVALFNKIVDLDPTGVTRQLLTGERGSVILREGKETASPKVEQKVEPKKEVPKVEQKIEPKKEGVPSFADTKKPLTEDSYRRNRETKKPSKVKRTFKDFRESAVEASDKFLGSISTRVGKISERIKYKLRELDYTILSNIQFDLKEVEPLMRRARKEMTKEDYADWDYARKNSDKEKINALVSKYGFGEEYAKYRRVLDRLRQDAVDVGLSIGYIEDYAPRILEDPKGFLAAIGKDPAEWGPITRHLKAFAERTGVDINEMSDADKAQLISNALLYGQQNLVSPQSANKRQLKYIPPELNQFYMDSDQALINHIRGMHDSIEARRFFGKVPDRIAETRRRLKRTRESMKEAKGAKLEQLKKRVAEYEGILERYASQRDFTENIGAYIMDLITKGEINTKDERILKEILEARFGAKGPGELTSIFKTLSYIDTMGSVTSALTQIGDLSWAAYDSGLITTLGNLAKVLTGKSRIKKEDLNIDGLAEELSVPGSLEKTLQNVFKFSGLTKMDAIGKEVLLNGAFDKYTKLAKRSPAKIKPLLNKMFGEQADSVLADLKAGDITENVKLLLFNRLLDFQPIALSEMPEKYLTAGNGRVFYMLKTFTLKQFDIFRREAYNKIRYGDKSEKIQGLKNLTKLSMFFVLANATADELKDWVLGRETDFDDMMVDNVLRLGGVSKYITWQARTEGLGTALAKQVLPPFKFINAVSKDLNSVGDGKGVETVASVPIVGKLYYWHMGKGTGKRATLWDQRLAKHAKKYRDIKTGLDTAADRRSYLNKHREDLRSYKRIQRFRSRVNRLKSVENKMRKKGPEYASKVDSLTTKRIDLIKKFLANEGT